ncbi:FAD/NAD(P)-binding domain superfamily [Arabidopsis suecica]|uniref:FAD/NAD(P)-binding domain superfamily n=1 Tax=Arabidopsis suecica TaxID=45249 RepID=A0A8T2H4P6_ARASU|nr:FAD/NAD(P)-binding domain superfamily [Arabidopsis suecica]
MSHFVFLFIISMFINLSQGAQMPYMTTDPKEVSGKSFDYIVVGGGTAGCSLAATLSEKYSVLVIERGGSPFGDPLVEERKYFGYSLLNTDEYSSVAQSFTSVDGIENYRGRVLGGSSAINGGFYSRASDEFVKKAGWDKDLVQDSYKWVESKVVFMPELTQWQSVVQFGFLEAGFYPYNGYSLEHTQGTKIGGSIYDQCGKRHTSADLLGFGKPNCITVLLNSTVKSIIFDGNKTRAVGVRFMESDGNSDRSYKAHVEKHRGEVILTAGALGSPQILLLSGIGPENHLKDFDIPVIVNLKEVGRKMSDNPAISLLVDRFSQNRTLEPPQVAAIAEGYKFILESEVLPTDITTTRISIAAKIAFPKSKGRLKLNSTNPMENPSVKFNYLKNKEDLDACQEMVLHLQHVARSETVTFFLGTQAQDKFVAGDEDLKNFCKQNVRTYYHYHGGCLVGSVVDEDYKVNGVKRLRVIDGSTFEESPGTNPMATVLMLGRYQGIKILKEREEQEIMFLSPQGSPQPQP